METLTANLAGRTRQDTLYDREYLVAPLSLIVPGVLNGSQGPLFYPPDEIAKNHMAWNHMPIVVYHPKVNGENVSARKSNVLNQQAVGLVLETNFNGKLTAEAWFDVERTRKVDNRILTALQSNEQIELSTGLITDNEVPEGENPNFNGTPYDRIARNYRPDHLAVLPDQKGACSLDDGCGVNVNADNNIHPNLLGSTGMTRKHQHTVRVDEEGFGQTNWVDGHIHLIKRFSLESSDGHTHALKRDSLVDTALTENEGEAMTTDERKTIVDDLVANCECWEEDDRETLNKFKDDKLTKVHSQSKSLRESDEKIRLAENKTKEMELVVNAAKKGFQVGNDQYTLDDKGEWSHKEQGKVSVTTNTDSLMEQLKGLTPEKWFEISPPEVQESVRESTRITNAEKAKLVESIVASAEEKDREVVKNHYQGQSLESLRMAALTITKPAEEDNPFSLNYSGAAGAGSGVVREIPKPEPLGQPVWNFEEQTA